MPRSADAAIFIMQDVCHNEHAFTCTCRPLCVDDVQGAALVLTRAFAGTAEAVKLDEAL